MGDTRATTAVYVWLRQTTDMFDDYLALLSIKMQKNNLLWVHPNLIWFRPRRWYISLSQTYR